MRLVEKLSKTFRQLLKRLHTRIFGAAKLVDLGGRGMDL